MFIFVHILDFPPLRLIPGSSTLRIPALSSKFRDVLGCALRGLFVKLRSHDFPESQAWPGSHCL